MDTLHATPTASVRIAANYEVTKRLGNWTTARQFQVRAHRGHAVLDLRSPDIEAGEITVDLELDHALLKLLVPDGAVVDDWDLRRLGRGRVKDTEGRNAAGGRRIVLTGQLRHAEVRVHRGGIAQLSAMFSREYLSDLRRAHAEDGFPTVDDPTRTA
jgi:hypothetical protein